MGQVLKTQTWRYFANCRWMPTITLIAIRTLHENAGVTQTFGENFTANVVQADTFANVTARLLDHLITVYI